ncbi:MAG: ABC transporter ATP-binding protein [Kiloniellales bacterium]
MEALVTPCAVTPGPLLEVRDLTMTFGGIVALDGVSFTVDKDQIVGLIGPNGAGKTTLFNCLSRLYRAQRGDILFEGRSILKTTPHGMATLGFGRTFQNLALFKTMSVLENVMVGTHSGTRGDFLNDALRLPWVAREDQDARARARQAIDYLDLGHLAHLPAMSLPFGTQKRVELARALMGAPKLLLLDEPAGGLNHEEVEALGELIRHIRDSRRLTVLLVEHHMNLVMQISDKVVTLDFGRKIAEGTPAEVSRHPEVIRAYLGGTD